MFSLKGILIMDNSGNRIWANYYNSLITIKEQKAFEKKLFSKSHKSQSEILMLDNFVVLYRSNVDLIFYVIGDAKVYTVIRRCLMYNIRKLEDPNYRLQMLFYFNILLKSFEGPHIFCCFQFLYVPFKVHEIKIK